MTNRKDVGHSGGHPQPVDREPVRVRIGVNLRLRCFLVRHSGGSRNPVFPAQHFERDWTPAPVQARGRLFAGVTGLTSSQLTEITCADPVNWRL